MRPYGVFLLLVAIAAGCSPFGSSDTERLRDRLEANRARWASQGFANYDLHVRAACQVCAPDALVRVRDGQPTVVVEPATGASIFLVRGPDVDELFEEVERGIERSAERFSVTYDRELGFPRHIDIDVSSGVADDEFSADVISLVESSEPVPTLSERVSVRRAQWESMNVSNYDFSLSREGVGVPDLPCCGVRIEVRGGVAISRTLRGTGEPLSPEFDLFFPPIGDLFDVLEEALGADPEVLEVGFDGELGFPTAIWVDGDASTSGREFYSVFEFALIVEP